MRRGVSILALGLSAALLAACARLPEHLPQNPTFQPQKLAFAGARHPSPWPRQDWWQAAHARQLDRLETMALQRNPGLRATAARVLYAQAQVLRIHAGLLPHFAAGLSLTQQYFSANGLHLQANGTSNLYGEVDPLLVHYHVDLWGRDRDLVEAARGELAMTQAQEADARLLLSTAVAVHYFALQGEEALWQREVSLQKWQQSGVTIAQAAFASGLQPATAVQESRISVQQSAERIAEIQSAIAAERHALAALCGLGPDSRSTAATGQLRDSTPVPALPANLPMSLLGHRPDIVARRWAVEAAAAQVRAAHAAFYPDINLNLLAGWNSIHLADLFAPGNFAHAFGPAITLPIFEGGALRGNLRAQNARFLAAQDQYQEQILTALRQIADLLSVRKHLQTREAALKQALQEQQAQWRLQEASWQAGLSDGAPRIAARVKILQLEEQRISLRIAAWQNWALLESALGGGYSTDKKQSSHDERKK